jgi:type IV pilus assembly protein PilX
MNNRPIENSPGVAGFDSAHLTPRLMPRQRGMALISALMLLLVMTIIGLSMFRSFGIQARIAGNTREKQRAVHAAEGAQAYAEWWVSGPGGGHATMGIQCSGRVTVTVPTDVQVCSNQITANTINALPWTADDGTQLGFVYQPTGMSTEGSDPYPQFPMFYIAYMNGAYDKQSGTQINNYRVDATGTGGTANAVAVVESTYQVAVTYTTQNSKTKFYSLTGP